MSHPSKDMKITNHLYITIY